MIQIQIVKSLQQNKLIFIYTLTLHINAKQF